MQYSLILLYNVHCLSDLFIYFLLFTLPDINRNAKDDSIKEYAWVQIKQNIYCSNQIACYFSGVLS